MKTDLQNSTRGDNLQLQNLQNRQNPCAWRQNENSNRGRCASDNRAIRANRRRAGV